VTPEPPIRDRHAAASLIPAQYTKNRRAMRELPTSGRFRDTCLTKMTFLDILCLLSLAEKAGTIQDMQIGVRDGFL
jgi:hypothetical protein